MFHNTTLEEYGLLKEYSLKAERQEKHILKYMNEHPFSSFTSEDLECLFPTQTPLTSIRRAMCNLKRDNKIVVIGKKTGQFNRPIFEYCIT